MKQSTLTGRCKYKEFFLPPRNSYLHILPLVIYILHGTGVSQFKLECLRRLRVVYTVKILPESEPCLNDQSCFFSARNICKHPDKQIWTLILSLCRNVFGVPYPYFSASDAYFHFMAIFVHVWIRKNTTKLIEEMGD